VITVLQYLVVAAAIGLVVFLIAVLVFGRGEQLAPLPGRTSPAELPDGGIAGPDIRGVRFAVGVRGYRMSDVDWTLDRLADEVDRLRTEVLTLGGDPDALADRTVMPEYGAGVDRSGVPVSDGGELRAAHPVRYGDPVPPAEAVPAADAVPPAEPVPPADAVQAADVVPAADQTSATGLRVPAVNDRVDTPRYDTAPGPDPMVRHRS